MSTTKQIHGMLPPPEQNMLLVTWAEQIDLKASSELKSISGLFLMMKKHQMNLIHVTIEEC